MLTVVQDDNNRLNENIHTYKSRSTPLSVTLLFPAYLKQYMCHTHVVSLAQLCFTDGVSMCCYM